MSESTELSCFTEQDFQAIETAVLETDKGRWFLNEFSQRNRVADTQTLLSALDRLERNLTAQPAIQVEEHPDIAALARAIDATCTDIAAVRNDMIEDHAEIPEGTAVFSHISQTAHKVAVDLISAAEALQGTVKGLRETAADSPHVDAIDGHASTLFDDGWRQDVLAQRVSKAMGLLEHLDQNLKALSGSPQTSDGQPASPDTVSQTIPAKLSPENLNYFKGDDEFFSEPAPVEADRAEAPLELVVDKAPQTAVEDPVTALPGDAEILTVLDENDAKDIETASSARPIEPAIKPNVVVIRAGRSATAQQTDENAAELPQTASEPAAATSAQDSNDAPAPDHPPPTIAEPVVTEVIIRNGQSATPEVQKEDTAEPAEDTSHADTSGKDSDGTPEAGEPLAATDAISTAGEESPEPSELSESADETGHQEHNSEAAVVEGEHRNNISDAMSAFAEVVVAPVETPAAPFEAPQPEMTATQEEKQRIVVIRRTSSEEAEIPFADYLGIDAGIEVKDAS